MTSWIFVYIDIGVEAGIFADLVGELVVVFDAFVVGAADLLLLSLLGFYFCFSTLLNGSFELFEFPPGFDPPSFWFPEPG